MTEHDIRLPVTLLTGFLGAGKSTLLNFLLRNPTMAGTAVVINEYGSVGIDHHLVESVPEDTALVEDGCLCCTARDQLADAMIHLLSRAQLRSFNLQRIIIETTGLAEPAPILQQLLHHPQLAERFALDSVVTVVDAQHALETLSTHEIAVQQITAADHLLISKTDLAAPDVVDALACRLGTMNPDARIDTIARGATWPEHLFSGGCHNPASTAYALGTWFADADRLRFTPVPSGTLLGFGNHAPRHEHDIQTFSLIIEESLLACRFLGWIDFLRTLCGPTLLRVKGLVHVTGQSGPMVVHGVQRTFHPITTLAAWPSDDHRTRLVFITRGWGQDFVGSTLSYLRASTVQP